MKYDVVIIGAGPAGLSCTRSLHALGLKVALVEKMPVDALRNPLADGREIALTHLSKHILEELGVWQAIPQSGIANIDRARVLDGNSSWFMEFDNNMPDGQPLGHIVSNHLIRRALFDGVEKLDNVTLYCGNAIRSIHRDYHLATVTFDDGRRLDATLLVAADSRVSPCRRMVGIGASMRDTGHTIIVCRMQIEKPHNGIAFECFHYGGTLAILPLPGKEISAVITVHNEEVTELLARDEDKFNEAIGRRFNQRLGSMHICSKPVSYPLTLVHADQYSKRRIALVGDAAVGMHPVTAHGFNLGLRGQNTLAGIIDGALLNQRDIGAADLLADYGRRHRRIVTPLYTATNNLVRLYTNDSFPARLARKVVLQAGNRIKPIRQRIVQQLMEKV